MLRKQFGLFFFFSLGISFDCAIFRRHSAYSRGTQMNSDTRPHPVWHGTPCLPFITFQLLTTVSSPWKVITCQRMPSS